MVAYAMYKNEVIAHVRNGKDKKTFLDVNLTPQARSRYKRDAQGLVNTMLQINLDTNLGKLKEPLINQINGISRVSIKPLRKRDRLLNWHNSGLGGFVPTFWKTMVVLAVFYSPLYDNIESTVSTYIKAQATAPNQG